MMLGLRMGAVSGLVRVNELNVVSTPNDLRKPRARCRPHKVDLVFLLGWSVGFGTLMARVCLGQEMSNYDLF